MNPLIFSLVCLVMVAISANFLNLIKESKTLLYISTIPCVYLVIYGVYLIFGSVDLHEDASTNFFNKNPDEKELPIVFIILKFYEYILILVGLIFGYVFSKKFKNERSWKSNLMKKNIFLVVLIIVGMFIVFAFREHNRERSISACIMAQKNKSEIFDIDKAKKYCQKEIKDSNWLS